MKNQVYICLAEFLKIYSAFLNFVKNKKRICLLWKAKSAYRHSPKTKNVSSE